MWPNSQETSDLVAFTEEIHDGKLHFLCSVYKTTDYDFQSYLNRQKTFLKLAV